MIYLPPAPQLAAFIVVAGLLTITPGADMALVMRHALGGGTRPAFFASLGICVGTLIWGAASALGVSVLFAQSAFAFAVLKSWVRLPRVCSALARSYQPRRARRTRRKRITRATENSSRPSNLRGSHGQWKAFAQGLFTNLLNPKVCGLLRDLPAAIRRTPIARSCRNPSFSPPCTSSWASSG